MTTDDLQELIDAVDGAVDYVPPALGVKLRTASNLLVDLPDGVVEGLALRPPEKRSPPTRPKGEEGGGAPLP